MTKKHFIDLANRLKELRRWSMNPRSKKIHFDTVFSAIADYCDRQNPNFDRQRFTDAVYQEDEK